MPTWEQEQKAAEIDAYSALFLLGFTWNHRRRWLKPSVRGQLDLFAQQRFSERCDVAVAQSLRPQ